MLITSNTIAPILDAGGKPLANGTLLVLKGNTEQSEEGILFRIGDNAQLFRTSDAAEGVPAPNPIPLDSAGKIPYPVWAKDAGLLWCFAYRAEGGEPVRTWPLYSGSGAGEGNEQSELIKEKITVTGYMNVKGKTIVEGSIFTSLLDVTGKLEVKENFTHQGQVFNDKIKIAAYNSLESNSNSSNNFPIGSFAIAGMPYYYVEEEGIKHGDVIEGGFDYGNKQPVFFYYVKPGNENGWMWKVQGLALIKFATARDWENHSYYAILLVRIS